MIVYLAMPSLHKQGWKNTSSLPDSSEYMPEMHETQTWEDIPKHCFGRVLYLS